MVSVTEIPSVCSNKFRDFKYILVLGADNIFNLEVAQSLDFAMFEQRHSIVRADHDDINAHSYPN